VAFINPPLLIIERHTFVGCVATPFVHGDNASNGADFSNIILSERVSLRANIFSKIHAAMTGDAQLLIIAYVKAV
jgi:hypothetical protein